MLFVYNTEDKMKLHELFDKDSISIHRKGASKRDILREVVWTLPFEEEKKEEIFSLVMEREEIKTTGIGEGVAVPHAKVDMEEDITARLVLSKEPISFDSVDGQPVHLIFFVLSHSKATEAHIKALARISRLSKKASFRNRLISSENESEAWSELASEEEQYAS